MPGPALHWSTSKASKPFCSSGSSGVSVPALLQQKNWLGARVACSATDNGTASTTSPQQQVPARAVAAPWSVSVDSVVVQPAYRSTPWEAEAKRAAAGRDKALILFVSESGICRGPLAAGAFKQLLQSSPLRDWLAVDMRATRDYCEGQQPDPLAAAAAESLGFALMTSAAAAAAAAGEAAAAGASSSGSDGGSDGSGAEGVGQAAGAAAAAGVRVFHPANDIVAADLVLVMDKYTAADVLREVSAYDLINPGGHYSSRVRMLGSFHPQLASRTQTPDGQDVDDALYGNEGGEEEQVAVLSTAKVVVESCRNLLSFLEDLAVTQGLVLPQQGTRAEGPSATAAAAATATGVPAGAGSSNGDSSRSGSSGSAAAKFKAVLMAHVQQEGVIDWLVPPMLQGSNTDVDGWV